MQDTQRAAELVATMEQETAALNDLSAQQHHLRDAVAARDWQQLDQLLPRLGALGHQVEDCEAQRHRRCAAISGSEHYDLATVLTRLPDAERGVVRSAAQQLKLATLRLKAATTQVDTYVRSAAGTTRAVLGELSPAHRAAGYAPDGQGTLPTTSALMVNTRM